MKYEREIKKQLKYEKEQAKTEKKIGDSAQTDRQRNSAEYDIFLDKSPSQ